jgi:hypothetical protein
MKARGNGNADTVTDEGWQRYGDRAELALSSLKEAATLPDKCPYWYDAMMQVAVEQGWSKERTKALVIPPRLPSRSNIDDRAPGDVQPVFHACGEQVRADFWAGSHVVFRKNFWASAGKLAFAGFVDFGRVRLPNLKDLANCIVRK